MESTAFKLQRERAHYRVLIITRISSREKERGWLMQIEASVVVVAAADGDDVEMNADEGTSRRCLWW